MFFGLTSAFKKASLGLVDVSESKSLSADLHLTVTFNEFSFSRWGPSIIDTIIAFKPLNLSGSLIYSSTTEPIIAKRAIFPVPLRFLVTDRLPNATSPSLISCMKRLEFEFRIVITSKVRSYRGKLFFCNTSTSSCFYFSRRSLRVFR